MLDTCDATIKSEGAANYGKLTNIYANFDNIITNNLIEETGNDDIILMVAAHIVLRFIRERELESANLPYTPEQLVDASFGKLNYTKSVLTTKSPEQK